MRYLVKKMNAGYRASGIGNPGKGIGRIGRSTTANIMRHTGKKRFVKTGSGGRKGGDKHDGGRIVLDDAFRGVLPVSGGQRGDRGGLYSVEKKETPCRRQPDRTHTKKLLQLQGNTKGG